MNGASTLETLREIMRHSIEGLGASIADLAPKLLAALVILALGWAISKLVEKVSTRAFRRLGLDRASERIRLADALRQGGVTMGASGALGRLLFWILLLAFLLPALEALGLTAVAATIDRLVAYLPRVLAAALILVGGLLAGRFVRNFMDSAAVVADLGPGRYLATAMSGIVVTVVVVLALEQLGIETRFLILMATVLAGTLGLTMGLSLALGAKKVFTHIFAGHFLRQSLDAGQVVEFRGRKGAVERVGAVDTLFRDDDRAWTVPNATLLEEPIDR